MEYIGKGGTVGNFRAYCSSSVKVKENKVISLIRRNDTGPPALIEFNKGDTNMAIAIDEQYFRKQVNCRIRSESERRSA